MRLLASALLALAWAIPAHAGFTVVTTSGEADVELNYNPVTQRLGIEIHFEDNPPGMQHFDTDEVLFFGFWPQPATPQPSPLGPTPFTFPQFENPNLPYVGVGAAEDPDESLSPYFLNPVQLEFVGMSGPGDFALWQDDGLGGFLTFVDSTDGFGPTDFLPVDILGHDHYNWSFSQEGFYQLFVQARGTLAPAFGGGVIVSDVYALNFNISSTPAPPAIGLLGVGAVALTGIVRRRGRK